MGRTGSTTKGIVVVADNSLIVEAIRLGLERTGCFTILGHADGRSASIRAIVDAEPDVVLVDDLLQAGDGISLIRQIHAEDESIYIILLTIEMDHDRLEEALDAGASAAISKRIHPVAFGTLVRETVNGNIVHVFSRRQDEPAKSSDCPLTARELEILQLTAGGSTNGEIARQLWVTEQTVKFHLSNLYRKLDVSNRTEACNYAHTHGLLEIPRGRVTKIPQEASVAAP